MGMRDRFQEESAARAILLEMSKQRKEVHRVQGVDAWKTRLVDEAAGFLGELGFSDEQARHDIDLEMASAEHPVLALEMLVFEQRLVRSLGEMEELKLRVEEVMSTYTEED